MSRIFFFNDTATTEIYTLSLHDALPISTSVAGGRTSTGATSCSPPGPRSARLDRKSTRLNSSHLVISYAVFCLKKKTVHHRHGHRSAPVSTRWHAPSHGGSTRTSCDPHA